MTTTTESRNVKWYPEGRGAPTPYGPAHYREELAPGLAMYGTSQHGGLRASGAAERRIPPSVRLDGPYSRHPWYEEDCDWAIPVYFSLLHVSPQWAARAIKSIKTNHPNLLTNWPPIYNHQEVDPLL